MDCIWNLGSEIQKIYVLYTICIFDWNTRRTTHLDETIVCIIDKTYVI